MTLITILSLKLLNTDITSLQTLTCGSYTRKILQTLRKLFLRLATLLPSVTYEPFYITKVYGLKRINELLLYGPYII